MGNRERFHVRRLTKLLAVAVGVSFIGLVVACVQESGKNGSTAIRGTYSTDIAPCVSIGDLARGEKRNVAIRLANWRAKNAAIIEPMSSTNRGGFENRSTRVISPRTTATFQVWLRAREDDQLGPFADHFSFFDRQTEEVITVCLCGNVVEGDEE